MGLYHLGLRCFKPLDPCVDFNASGGLRPGVFKGLNAQTDKQIDQRLFFGADLSQIAFVFRRNCVFVQSLHGEEEKTHNPFHN